MLSADARLTDAGRAALLAALRVTLARKVEPEHVLIAMLDDAASPLTRECVRLKPTLDVVSLRDTLIASARGSGGQPVAAWADDLLAPRAAEALAAAGALADATAEVRVRLFAAAALAKAKNSVRNTFTYSGVDAAELGRALEAPPPAAAAVPDAFTADGELSRDAFDGPARAVLRLVETEGKGLGLQRVGTPLLLFALVGRENGLLDRGLRVQAVDPRALYQHLQLHLRALGKSVMSDALPLRRTTMPQLVAEVFETAVRLAGDQRLPAAGEGELVRALLMAGDPFVASTLATYKVDVKALSEFAANRAAAEEEASDEWTIPPIEEVEERLRTRVVGQGHVVDAILPMLKRLRFGYTRRGRPMGVLLFLGTSGTGKTLLAKEIARAVYGSEEKLIFLEMGQFGTEYSKTMFIGAPPGLVGYGEGLLTNGIRDKPESVVLFDEVEKAHKSVFDVLLRFLDEGQIADPAGPIRDGRKCVLVLTSNHALDVLRPVIDRQTAAAGNLTPALRDQIRTEARAAILQTEFFRPEFLNRVDDILLFNTFGPDTYRLIVGNLIKEEQARFRDEKDLDVSADDDLVDYLVELCVARSDEGARVCGRLVSQFFVGPLIDFFVVDANRRHRAARVVMTERVGEVEVVPGGAA